jgi:hypothetical protein
MFPAYYIFNFLLSILLVLHVTWTYYILKILYRAIYSNKVRAAAQSCRTAPGTRSLSHETVLAGICE